MKRDGLAKKRIVFLTVVFLSVLLSSMPFANSVSTSGMRCSKAALSAISEITVLYYAETKTSSYRTSLVPSKRNLINTALKVKRDFLVRLATLEVKLNFTQVLVYVNVNRRNVMSFMENRGVSGNERVYRSDYFGSDVYFVISTRIFKTPQGYYFLKVNVEMLNSIVKQWTKNFTYAVPIEFTLLMFENTNSYDSLLK